MRNEFESWTLLGLGFMLGAFLTLMVAVLALADTNRDLKIENEVNKFKIEFLQEVK